MKQILNRKSALEKRTRRVEKELARVSRDLRAMEKAMETPGVIPDLLRRGARRPEPRPDAAPQAGPAPTPRRPGRVQDERFKDYLASSLQTTRPLRHERGVQRNKAVAMVVCVLLVLLWLLLRFFL